MPKSQAIRIGILFFSLLLLSLIITETSQAQSERRRQRRPFQSQNEYVLEIEKQIAGKENEPAEDVFQNIKIFKGMPARRVLRIMEMGFSRSLGVECKFCHVINEWHKDDKAEKLTARKMWKFAGDVRKMVKEAVDEKASVNCYTCHRGEPEPALRPKEEKK